MRQYRILIDGQWIETGKWIEVLDKYHLKPFAQIASADVSLVNKAADGAKRAQKECPLTPFQRYQILMKASQIFERRKEEAAEILSREVGKTKKEALVEVGRVVNNFILAAEESGGNCSG